ncbi:MAG: hypothetical protein MJ060_04270 [Clostridia bacterium]|nr:hypothetical protein [Clostridia bacterium]
MTTLVAGKEKEIQDRFDYLEENKLIKEGKAYTAEQLKERIPEEPEVETPAVDDGLTVYR